MSARSRVFADVGWPGVLAVAVSFLAIVVAFALTVGPYRLATTHGTSMHPVFHSGDLVVVHSESRYHVGDVLAYHALEGGIVLHRVVHANHDRFVLKGDNNRAIDPNIVERSQVVGEAELHVPRGGFLRAPLGLSALLVILLALMWFPVVRGRRAAHDVAAATTPR